MSFNARQCKFVNFSPRDLCRLKGRYNNGDSIQSTFNSFLQINRKISEVFILKKVLNKSFKTSNGYTPFLMCDSLT